jgi:adenine-specific DNA-methyltransferase
MANRIQIQTALQKPYDRILFGKEVLSPVFGSCFNLSSSAVPASVQPNKSEQAVIQSVSIYGTIKLEDGTEITCYEIILQPSVRIEHSKVAIQRYVRKLLTAGQIALVNFIAPQNKKVWRLTLVAKDSELTEQGIKEKTTHAKRYTYLLGPSETCKTAAERFESLSTEKEITFQALVNAFSVEKLSKAFFDEYTLHYKKFCDYLQESNFRKSVFKITIPANATKEEKDKACKPIRDFVKKLLGRIVFLYFVQKKGWLGASDTQYTDGLTDFIKQLFKQSGGNDAFYSTWLSKLFFETLNKERNNDDFIMPDGKKVKVPFLNGGLFDKEDFDEAILTIPATLFHNPDFEDIPLTGKNNDNARGFLDFLDAFNFTVHEDSPDDHTVAVDPEMLGHIFENLLEDNKDKGAFYTPKEIVHYMCQESLTEYLTTHLSKEYTVYKEIGNAQVELFGNETKTGQLKMVEQLGDKALNRDDVAYIVKHKDISHLTKAQLKKIDGLLDTVKICDPAIGSGAFPMGLLQEIHAIKEVIAYELQQPWKPADVKENIIQNSVYGVDIEKGAVDIARLRFWLSLVVDEEKPRALPNLDYKIVVGDSLVSKFEGEIIEIDWERKSSVGKADTFVQNIQRLLKEIAEKQKKFFKPDNKDKKKLQAEIRNLKLELLINQLSFNKEVYKSKNTIVIDSGLGLSSKEKAKNLEVEQKISEFKRVISKLQKLKQNREEPFEHFDWKLDFPEVLNPYLEKEYGIRGFDIVIGNPPYISYYGNTGSDLSDDEKKYVVRIFDSVAKESDRINSMNLFSEKGIKLLKPSGNLAFIVNKTMGVLPSYTYYRDYIINNVQFKYVITDLIPFQAIVDCLIFSIENQKPKAEYTFKFYRGDIEEYSLESISAFKKNKKLEFHIPKNDGLLDLIDAAPSVLSDILTINRGVNIGGCFDIFLSERKSTANHFKYLSGTKCVKPYFYEWSESDGYMIFDEKKEKQLRSQGKTLALGNHARYLQPRLFIPESAQTIMAAYSEERIYSAYGLLVGTTDLGANHLKYSCALLNSKLITFYSIQREILRKGNKATPHVGVKGLNGIPIFTDMGMISTVAKITDFIIYLKMENLSSPSDQLMPTYFEQIIDGMVYELYFPDLIKKHKREIIQHLGELPEFTDKMSDEQKMKICKTVFNRLNDREHPVRVNLFYMSSIPEIAIIEGKNENN